MATQQSNLQDTGGDDISVDDTFEDSGILQRALDTEIELHGSIAFSGATKNKQDEMLAHVKNLVKLIMEQQVMITHMMGRMSSPGERVPTSYANMIRTSVKTPRVQAKSRSRSKTRKVHNVLVVPKNDQSSIDTRKQIQSRVNPSMINVTLNSLKRVNKGGIIIISPTNQDIGKLIEEFAKIDEIKNNFEICKPKVLDPSIIIFYVDESIKKKELLEGLRDQNEELLTANLQVSTCFKARFGKNWIVSMNPSAFGEVIKNLRLTLTGIGSVSKKM
ncbi:hypothetical protein AVEN_229360-1 [Araneus ventricosus]|uniref:Uncharacterized protein n=1 Tax=Araneus ventricosus TaxID=182803 RepID=A0A4Y2I2X8_ARAVE|nr:hypothetical protein AVEN_229360-1 [Araneus ventricosus]